MASLSFRFSQLIILLIRSITPLSFIYLNSLCLSYLNLFPFPNVFIYFLPHSHDSFFSVLKFSIFTIWMFAESIFYMYYRTSLMKLQARKHFNNALDVEQRRILFYRCIYSLGKSSLDLREVFRRWFYDTPFIKIRKGNFAQWLSWAYFDRELNELNQDDMRELNLFIALAERVFRHKFPTGFDPEVKCIRLTFDPIRSTSRPLIFYIFTFLCDTIAHISIRLMGFKERHIPNTDHTFWYRPALTDTTSSSNYFNTSRQLPLVFIHGIGIGFFPYLLLLYYFPKNVPVYLLEWRHVSMQLTEHVPTINDTVECLSKMLWLDGYNQACFVAHSLGTTAITWMLHYQPSLVRSIVLLDPVTFLLCEPTVCFNFIYRIPKTTLELLMQFFVCQELYIAHTISCHFLWQQNILFTEELQSMSASVVLSGHDAIVPSDPVRVYLENTLLTRKAGPPVDLMYFDGMQHGQWLLIPSSVQAVAAKIQAKCFFS